MVRRALLGVGLAVVGVGCAAGGAGRAAGGGAVAGGVVVREVVVMGTVLRAEVRGKDRGEAMAAGELAFAAVRRMDDLLSTWREDSEIARLNRAAPGRPVELGAELRELLREAAAWAERTEGAFDPGVGALVDAWDLRGRGRVPSDAALASALAASGVERFGLDGTPRRPDSAAWLDTGGFGKGAALRTADSALRAAGIESALLNFGGQVLAVGAPARRMGPEDRTGRPGWDVPVAHPRDRERPVALLRLHDRSAATSAQSERFVTVDGIRYGHLLDPRNGRPVPAWGGVTVVAEDALEADVLSTALFVLGPESGQAWAERRGIAALFVVAEGDGLALRATAEMAQYLVQDFSTSTSGVR